MEVFIPVVKETSRNGFEGRVEKIDGSYVEKSKHTIHRRPEQEEGFILPHDVPANEYLNLEGKKMSTSRNWTVWVEDYLKYFNGEYLRYVLAVNAPENKDSDFSWKDFQSRINSELNNVLGNLANRTFVFSQKYFDGNISQPKKLSETSKNCLLEAEELAENIKNAYNNYQVRKAARLFMDIARIGNKFFDETKPWATVKQNKEQAEETLFICCSILQTISIAAAPIIPQSMEKLREMLNLPNKIK